MESSLYDMNEFIFDKKIIDMMEPGEEMEELKKYGR